MSHDGSGDGQASGATATPPRPGQPGLLRSLAHRLAGDTPALPDEGALPSFAGATGWLNSEPLTPEGLRGRVVVADFWTYTCINWLRTAPYRRAWHAKYAGAGLTLIGVHTPEFGFERDVENVVPRSRDFGVEYPIAIDSDYGVWEAFSNHFWPALYVADAAGRLRYHHFGEGEYAMAEMVIQQLLIEAGATDLDLDLVSVEPTGFEVGADWRTLRTPETYLGYGRSAGFVAPEQVRLDVPQAWPDPGRLGLNEWGLAGSWIVARHAAVTADAGARLAFGFQARDVNLVMGPPARGTSVPFRVRLDGAVPGASHGFDIDAEGNGTLADQRLHQLIRQPDAAAGRGRTIEIEFLGAGAEAYCFTFG
jgi:thiol-disulfide isomerase/thioredoxin